MGYVDLYVTKKKTQNLLSRGMHGVWWWRLLTPYIDISIEVNLLNLLEVHSKFSQINKNFNKCRNHACVIRFEQYVLYASVRPPPKLDCHRPPGYMYFFCIFLRRCCSIFERSRHRSDVCVRLHFCSKIQIQQQYNHEKLDFFALLQCTGANDIAFYFLLRVIKSSLYTNVLML